MGQWPRHLRATEGHPERDGQACALWAGQRIAETPAHLCGQDDNALFTIRAWQAGSVVDWQAVCPYKQAMKHVLIALALVLAATPVYANQAPPVRVVQIKKVNNPVTKQVHNPVTKKVK